MVFAAALVHVASLGSLSPEALHDPLFWGAIAAIALAVSVVTRRSPVAAKIASAAAGACAMMATLLPRFPDFASSYPDVTLAVARESLGALSSQLGVVATVMLIAVWIHAIAFGGERRSSGGHISAAARGALGAALVFSLAGAVPTTDGLEPAWFAALGILIGLAEARPARDRDRRLPHTL